MKECPTLLEVFSYIFYFPSAVVGPSFEFSDYRKFIYTLDEYKNFPLDLAVKSSMKEFAKGIICMGLYFAMKGPFDYLYLITEEYGNSSLIYKVN